MLISLAALMLTGCASRTVITPADGEDRDNPRCYQISRVNDSLLNQNETDLGKFCKQ